MVNLILGVVLIILGFLGVRSNWWLILDLLKAFLSLGLVFFGMIALLAGIRNIKSE